MIRPDGLSFVYWIDVRAPLKVGPFTASGLI
jgi:hypothetical protein